MVPFSLCFAFWQIVLQMNGNMYLKPYISNLYMLHWNLFSDFWKAWIISFLTVLSLANYFVKKKCASLCFTYASTMIILMISSRSSCEEIIYIATFCNWRFLASLTQVSIFFSCRLYCCISEILISALYYF